MRRRLKNASCLHPLDFTFYHSWCQEFPECFTTCAATNDVTERNAYGKKGEKHPLANIVWFDIANSFIILPVIFNKVIYTKVF
jgi:hypothetical protein